MADKIQFRRDTAARWAEVNPILLSGEIGLVTDSVNKYKLGNGVDHWNDLPLQGFNGNLVDIPGTDSNSAMSQKGATDLVSEYNVSANNSNAEYTFAQAVALVPASLQKGGLTIKYIDSTTHEYAIKRLMSSTWNTTESNWQGIDDEPTANSNNLVKSGGVYNSTPSVSPSAVAESDLDIADPNGNVLARFSGGHFKVKNFDSREVQINVTNDEANADFDISDEQGHVLVKFSGGHIKTKNFDSRNGGGSGIPEAPRDGHEYVRKNGSWVVNSASPESTYPKPVIFDTDWWTDVDDACAIRVLLWAERMRIIDVVGICVDAIRSTSASSLSSFLNYEGRSNLCIGMDKQAIDYDGTPSYHNTCINNWPTREYNSNNECQDCVGFYRRALTSTANKVDIICVGYTNALSRLLDSPADEYSPLTGIQLITEKVNHLWVMAGNYPSGSENNFTRTARSRAAGVNICANWPTEMTFLGYEVGIQVICGNTLSSTIGSDDLLYQCLVAHGSGSGRYAWDPMATLMACYGDMTVAGYNVTVGTNVVNPLTGANTFTANPNGKHRYVTMKYPTNYYQYQINKILEKIAWGYRTLGEQSISKEY